MPTEKPTGRLLSKKAYQTLLTQITRLIDSADEQSNEAKLESNWNVGRRINEARLSEKSGYHNTIIRDLAQDTRVSIRVLQESALFHKTYEVAPTDTGLAWSHYRQLMRLPTAARKRFEKAAIAGDWTARDLSAALTEAETEAEGGGPLKRPTDPTYLFPVIISKIVDADTVDVDIDLGFQVTRHQRLRLARIDAPPIKTKAGREARNALARHLHAAKTSVILTERIDLHGRYVAHLFTSTQKLPTLTCLQKGKYINAVLVEEGHAVAKRRG